MSDNYIIEIRPKSAGVTVQAGVVVRDGGGFRFFAATHVFQFSRRRAVQDAASCRTRSAPLRHTCNPAKVLPGNERGASLKHKPIRRDG